MLEEWKYCSNIF